MPIGGLALIGGVHLLEVGAFLRWAEAWHLLTVGA